jgi:hypothetical protein
MGSKEYMSQRLRVFGAAVIGGLLLVGAVVNSARGGSTHADGVRVPVLVELFTSEGCSSCPPADRLLQKLDQSQPVQNAELIVLSEHVDYWNHDGWRDPFSSAFFTERQQHYSSRFGLGDVYTPQMVVDGRAQFVGNDAARAAQTIGEAARTPRIPVRISGITLDNGELKFRVEAERPASSSAEQADVYVVLADERATSRVSAGENSGRDLTHVAVARQFTKVGVVPGMGSFSKDVDLKVAGDWPASGFRLIAFLQEPGQGTVLGAALQHVAR